MDQTATEHPLTHPQSSIWYLEKLNPGTGICNIAATMRLAEDLDYERMNQAVNLLLKRNQGFHIRIRERDGRPVQYFAPFEPYRLDFFDFSEAGREKLYEWDLQQTRVPFEVLDSDLFYFALVRIDKDLTGFFVRVHHLIGDAWSQVKIANDIVMYYRALQNGLPIPEEDDPSYVDFILSEQEYLKSARYEADRTYWRERYALPPEPTSLKSRPTGRIGLNARRKTFVLPDKLVKKIKSHCSENRTSVFALFFSALCIYVNRVKDVSDLVFGTPVLNRTNVREKRTIGMFISTVPLRIHIDGEQDFVEFSKSVDLEWFGVLKHQKYPYDHLLRDVREQRKDVDKLFDMAVSYQNAKMVKDGDKSKEESRWHFNGYQVESLYLHINDREDDGKLVLNYDYQTDLFYAKEIDFLHEHLMQLLWHALDNPTRKLSEVHMLGEKEKAKVLETFNATQAGYPEEATVSGLFEAQAKRTPDAVALSLGRKSMTYRELDAKASRLAWLLRDKGVGPETIVSMLLPRSFEMVVGILGIVKAGGAYLPIDPDYPADRIEYMLEDSGTKHLLFAGDSMPDLHFSGERIDLCGPLADDCDGTVANCPDQNRPSDLLYVIYTSGTTGRPKGAMIEHRNLVRLLFNDRNPFDFGPSDCWTLFHNYCFDFSVWEMYGALLYGGRLVIVPKDVARNTDRFLDLLIEEKVTVLNQTPAAFYNLIDAVGRCTGSALSLRIVVFGGDALKPLLLKPFRARYPQTRMINMYGITETTVHVTFLELSDEDIERNVSNIGRPIPTTMTYILDRKLNPQPIGIPGELCVSGDGVGRGYLNNAALTAQKFIPDPFHPGRTLYRSGDLARYYPQGDIEYLGRIDTQVKIRGHRIELGEVESGMLRFDRIAKATVLTLDAPGGSRRMCAYYVPRADFEVQELRVFLSRFLPDYMVPTYFVAVDHIPLNANGKVDRGRLPPPDQDALDRDTYVEPQNELQATLARVWCEALKVGRIGIDDDFFESGGDSLNAVVVISMMGGKATFGDLYRNPTVKRLAEAILRKETEGSGDQLLMKLAGTDAPNPLNLICFPFGGGNGLIYKDLADAVARLSSRANVYTVDLPGRVSGTGSALRRNPDLARQLVAEIKSMVTGEILVYGHCVGNALALETTQLLRRDGVPVKTYFAGAIMPPADPKRLGLDHDPWKHVPDRAILFFLERIGLPRPRIGQKTLDVMLRAFRHDVRNHFRFFHDDETAGHGKLDVPIRCVVGQKDPFTWYHGRRHRRWERYSDQVTTTVIAGADHYFLKTHAEELARILTDPE